MRQRGFSLVEMIVAVAAFTLIAGAAFALLHASQQRFKLETQFLDSFQGARLAMDQIIRDVHTAGYPPVSSVPCPVALNNPEQVAYPFAWAPNYVDPTCPTPVPAAGCQVGVNCNLPDGFDLIVETDIDPENNDGVEWVRYRLQGTTLFRAEADKGAGQDPRVPTLAKLEPYVENVVNNPPNALRNEIQAAYPAMFPGGNPVPIFTYAFDSPATPQVPQFIREVNITLLVMAQEVDPRTGQRRVATLSGLARRINP